MATKVRCLECPVDSSMGARSPLQREDISKQQVQLVRGLEGAQAPCTRPSRTLWGSGCMLEFRSKAFVGQPPPRHPISQGREKGEGCSDRMTGMPGRWRLGCAAGSAQVAFQGRRVAVICGVCSPGSVLTTNICYRSQGCRAPMRQIHGTRRKRPAAAPVWQLLPTRRHFHFPPFHFPPFHLGRLYLLFHLPW